MNDQFCLEFIQSTMQGQTANETDKNRFIDSLIHCHQNGLYLAFGKKNGWKLSNKNPEKLHQQIKDRQRLINTLFQSQ